MDFSRLGNKYLGDTEPWKLIDSNEARVQTILHICLQLTANLAIVMEPFLPFSAAKLNAMLGVEPLKWTSAGTVDLLQVGYTVNSAQLLFTKIEDATVEAQ